MKVKLYNIIPQPLVSLLKPEVTHLLRGKNKRTTSGKISRIQETGNRMDEE